MNLILEFDDFNPKKEVDCLAEIEYLVDRYPNIKLTMFTPAMYENNTLRSDPKWCNAVRKLIQSDNLRLAVHGCFHTSEEFKFKNKEEAISTIALAECMFRIAKLPFIRVFRGPHWGINQATYDALKWLEYTHVYTHPDYSTLADTNTDIKSIFYDWNLKDTYDPYKDPWNQGQC